jgi:hypothetical protein
MHIHLKLLESYRLLYKTHSNQSDMLIEHCWMQHFWVSDMLSLTILSFKVNEHKAWSNACIETQRLAGHCLSM